MPRGKRPNGPDYLNLIQLRIQRRSRRPYHVWTDCLAAVIVISIFASMGEASYDRDERRWQTGGFCRLADGNAQTLFHFRFCDGWTGSPLSWRDVLTLAREPANVFAAATGELMKAFLAALERGETPPV
jgi:hypothetical protein